MPTRRRTVATPDDVVAVETSDAGAPARPGQWSGRMSAAGARLAAGSRRAQTRARPLTSPVWQWCRPVLSVVSPLGWTILVAVVVAAWAGSALGWIELRYAAVAGLVLLIGCALLTIGRTVIVVDVSVKPVRVTVGDPSAGHVVVTNRSGRRLLPISLEIPVADRGIRFELPTLAGNARHDEIFLVPTDRRGVYPVGPATTVRGDPFGIMRRTVAWTEIVELFVHPTTVPLDSLGTGLVRDLEGQTTNDVSMSDLAFHALRDYAPGDDRRYIHWKSSAKVSAGQPGGKFLIRQFLDTRRSHITVVVDGRSDAYRGEDEFELAVSVGASIAGRAVRDEMETTVLVAGQLVDEQAGYLVMDAFACAVPVTTTLVGLAMKAFQAAPDTSTAFLVTGPELPFVDIRRAASHFPPETRVVAVRVDPHESASLTTASGTTVLRVPTLRDLPLVMRVVGAA